jgi:hypothetical protein
MLVNIKTMVNKNSSRTVSTKRETQAIKDWNKCVRRAKKKLGKGEDSWGILTGAVLKEAMRCYCAMGY